MPTDKHSIRLPFTLIETIKLLLIKEDEMITNLSQTLYQQKIGSLLFATIAI